MGESGVEWSGVTWSGLKCDGNWFGSDGIGGVVEKEEQRRRGPALVLVRVLGVRAFMRACAILCVLLRYRSTAALGFSLLCPRMDAVRRCDSGSCASASSGLLIMVLGLELKMSFYMLLLICCHSTADERQLKAVMEFRKAYSAQALEGSNIPKVTDRSSGRLFNR